MTPSRMDSDVATMPATSPTNMTLPGADEHLAEDVLPEVGGAEPVVRATAPWSRSWPRADGSYGATHGPMTAKST